jgi:hypothetical protein
VLGRALALGVALAAVLLVAAWALGGGAGEPGPAALGARDVPAGAVLVLRHAPTDPTQVDLDLGGGCDVQQGLSAAGVAQARDLGRRLADLPIGPVRTSPLCRAVDTAEALDLGPVEVEEGLRPLTTGLDASAQQAILDTGLLRLAGDLGGADVAVHVTHGENIQAMTGEAVAEGGGVVLVPAADGATGLGAFDLAGVLASEG